MLSSARIGWILAVLLVPQVCAAQTSAVQECRIQPGPVRLLATPDSSKAAFVERGAIFEQGQGFHVLGFPSLVSSADTTPAPPVRPVFGVTWTPGGMEEIPYPSKSHLIRFPGFARDRFDSLHAVWGSASSDPYGTIDELWHATLQGGQWSRPEKIAGSPGDSFRWNESSASSLQFSGDRLLMAVPATLDARLHAVVVFSRHDRRWQATEIPVRATPAYLALAATTSAGIALLTVSSDPQVPDSLNLLFVTISQDGGRLWSPPARIAGQGGEAHVPAMFFRGNILTAFWVEALTEPSSHRRLVASERLANGTWRSAGLPAEARQVSAFTAAQSGTGQIAIAGMTTETTGLVAATTGSGWCSAPLEFPVAPILTPQVSMGSSEIRISWSHPGSPPSAVPVTRTRSVRVTPQE